MAYLPGELRLYENMTGRQLVRFLGELRGERPARRSTTWPSSSTSTRTGPLTQMSSGMKRKVALLAVLLPKVPLVILDEPTNTLDPTMRDELLDANAAGQGGRQGGAVLVPRPGGSRAVCDRVVILRRGRLVHLQGVAELRAGRFVRAAFAAPPAAGPGGAALTAVGGAFETEHRGELGPLLDWLRASGATDVRIEPLSLGPIYARFHAAAD